MTTYYVPICVCHDPLDAHDPVTGKCMGVEVGGCSCTFFVDSGQRQKIEAT